MIATNTAEMVCEKCGGGLAKDWSGYHHSPAVDPAPEYDIGRHIPKPVPNPALEPEAEDDGLTDMGRMIHERFDPHADDPIPTNRDAGDDAAWDKAGKIADEWDGRVL